MEKKIVYLVLAYSLDSEAAPVICSVCDDESLARSFCEDVCAMSKYYKVVIEEYTLNCLEAW